MEDGKIVISRFLSDDGSDSGVKDMATTAAEYFILADEPMAIARLIVSYQDAGGGTVSEYGNLGAALSNGIEVQHIAKDGVTVLNDLTDGVPVVSNGHWARLCYDHDRLGYGSGEDVFSTRWTFERDGRPVYLDDNERLSVFIQDDLTNLSNHFARVGGWYQ